jgi:hypothetical protein
MLSKMVLHALSYCVNIQLKGMVMNINILNIDQGVTWSETSEGLTAVQCHEQSERLKNSGGRYVIFPTSWQMNVWRTSLAGIGLAQQRPR